ncbi:superkiller viralicidic activity 2 family [Cyclospora cayetanensis]|uniref:Superkiller viralicidic activity 2 family n=1 Tax=Cyclospora cayetanensis TaxID=88456 RepID=A0A1D3CT79_9EIME|nr:superkiller viralicidic activity 2 family [Cyclospora cayetanensis]
MLVETGRRQKRKSSSGGWRCSGRGGGQAAAFCFPRDIEQGLCLIGLALGSSSEQKARKKRRGTPASPETSHAAPIAAVKKSVEASEPEAPAELAVTSVKAGETQRADSEIPVVEKAFRDAPVSDGLVTRVLLSDKNCLHEVVYPEGSPTRFRDFQLQTTLAAEEHAAADSGATADPRTTTPTAARPPPEDDKTLNSPSTEDATAQDTGATPSTANGEDPVCTIPSLSPSAEAATTEELPRAAARQWKFVLDTFQQRSVLCLEAGENVLVAAHTSAGKTVVAEYAIAMALRDKQRVVYTSPIKALSNQKYRDLCDIFGTESVGLLTGDVSVHPEASIVVMTTEILRSMLYRGSVLVRERQPCHVLYTEKRPTPLQHYMYPQGGEGVFLVMDEHKVFREDSFLRAKECEANAQALIGRGDGSPTGNSSGSVSLTSEEERKLIAEIFQNAVNTLDEEDRQLPQIKSILPLLLRGIGIHHGGLLPFVREIIEILFQESLIRVLFSTETFSMGVNMPAKTVVFTAIRKWDGVAYRLLNGGEYIQMAGRAGRRGLDDRGIAIIMFDEQVDPEEAKGLFTGGAAPLISSFHLGFNMLLNLFRIEDADPAYMISRSFAYFQQHRRSLGLHQELQELQEKLQAAADIRSLVSLPEGTKEPDFDVEEAICSFYGRKHELLQQGRLLRAIAMQPQHLVRFLQPGRLVSLVEDDGTEWGWATCVHKLQKRKVPSTNAHEGPVEQLLVHCLVSCNPTSVQPLECKEGTSGKALGNVPLLRPKKPRPAPPVGEEGKDYVLEIVPFSVSCVSRVSKCKMSLPAGGDVESADARRSICFQLQIIQDKFKDCGGLPLLDPVVDMKVDHPQLAELVSRMAASEAALKENPFNEHPLCALYYAAQHRRMQMESRLRHIRTELDAQKETAIKDSLRSMRRVLHRLGFLEGEDVVTLKGRVACEVSTADELLASELLFSNALKDLTPEELCAVLSCLVCHEKHDEPEPTEPRLLAGSKQQPLLWGKQGGEGGVHEQGDLPLRASLLLHLLPVS